MKSFGEEKSEVFTIHSHGNKLDAMTKFERWWRWDVGVVAGVDFILLLFRWDN